MRVILTGGSGFIGRALAADLVADGAQVIVLSRDPDGPTVPKGVEAVKWDGATADGWEALADGADAIVNLAGENIGGGWWTPERKRRIRESRVRSGRAVAEAVARATVKPRVVAQGSAVGYYGPSDREVGEADGPGKDFLSRVCFAWEASSAEVQTHGVRWLALRTGIVLGRDGGVLPRMALPFRWFAGGPLGDGGQWVPWIHVRDEVRAIRFLLGNEAASGPFNLTAPNPVRNEELAAALGRTLGRPAAMRAPAFAIRLVLGEMATLLLDGQRAVPRRLIEMGFQFEFGDLDVALRGLLNDGNGPGAGGG